MHAKKYVPDTFLPAWTFIAQQQTRTGYNGTTHATLYLCGHSLFILVWSWRCRHYSLFLNDHHPFDCLQLFSSLRERQPKIKKRNIARFFQISQSKLKQWSFTANLSFQWISYCAYTGLQPTRRSFLHSWGEIFVCIWCLCSTCSVTDGFWHVFLFFNSLMVYAVARKRRADELNNDDEKLISHPYAVGALISSISFVVIFRANFGYQRYAYIYLWYFIYIVSWLRYVWTVFLLCGNCFFMFLLV